jgi:hypothetical protein
LLLFLLRIVHHHFGRRTTFVHTNNIPIVELIASSTKIILHDDFAMRAVVYKSDRLIYFLEVERMFTFFAVDNAVGSFAIEAISHWPHRFF